VKSLRFLTPDVPVTSKQEQREAHLGYGDDSQEKYS
jgi:hypothetical protein